MGVNMTQVEAYCLGLKAWRRRDEGACIAWCPGLAVLSQAETEDGAMEALREAVELWFESCVERGVLAEALGEVGIIGPAHGEPIPAAAGAITICQPTPLGSGAGRHGLSITLGEDRRTDRIEARIPGHLLADHIGWNPAAASAH